MRDRRDGAFLSRLRDSGLGESVIEREKSDCNRSGILPASINVTGEPPWYSSFLNGIVKVAMVPASSLESRWIVPRIKSTRFLHIVNPSPVPPKRLAVLESAWLKGRNNLFLTSSSIPIPLSSTQNSTVTESEASLKRQVL